MTQTTDNAYTKIDLLVELTMQEPPQVFPYTVRQLAEMFGVGYTTVYRHLDSNPFLYRSGKRWFYRHNAPRHE